ncbi:MAG: leucine-rich repeat domain-containing protein [Lachnospiraceae bacterium]|nr:leucine-rich repeat domain-containing protein [Lachnospiraceae bacterium]MCM1229994.1 leucine-rich repeat domain-containing protein [Ruminococcus flavefaciens]
MGFSYGFFNSNGLDRTYTAENFCDYLGSLICNGIQDNYGDCFSLTASGGLSVTIGTGKAWINGHYFINDTPHTVDLSGYQDLSLPRYVSVSIVCDTSDDVRDVHIEITAGTPAVEPETVDFNDIPQKTRLRLYNIRLNPSATSLSDYDWFDHRNDENICGYVKCILGKCRITEVINEFQATATEVQGLRQQVADLAKVETEMQEYIAKTGDLQEKVDSLFHLVGFVVGEEVIDAGKIGDNVYYAVYSNGTVELSGSGETYSCINSDTLEVTTPFFENKSITNLVVADEITYLGDMLFESTGLTSLEISANIGIGTFADCANLKTVRLDCEKIGSMAFYACPNLETVVISTAIKEIEEWAFTHSAQVVTYEGTLEQWKNVKKDYWVSGIGDEHPQTVEKVICTDGYFEYDSDTKKWNEVSN